MNGSKIHNFNAKYHHIINDLFAQFFSFFQPKTWEILVNLTKISTFSENFNKFITKLEKINLKYIISQSMDPKSINFNAKYHNIIFPDQYIQNPQLQCL
jgi:hypothetical protein